MRVLLIDVNCKQGSTGKIVYDLYSNLNSNGDEAAICYGRGPKIKEKNIYKFGIDVETCLHALLARIFGLNGFFSFFSTIRLIRFIKKFNPDVIHIHELHAYFINYFQIIRFFKKYNKKYVWTFHCEYNYTGKCGYSYECVKWQNACGSCPLKKQYPKSLLFDFSKYMFKMKKRELISFNFCIVSPSKWLSNRIGLSFLQNKKRLIIHNGIDSECIFKPIKSNDLRKEFGINKDAKIILSVAPNIMEERKGGKAVIQLSKRPAMQNYVFVMIGCDCDYEREYNLIRLKKTNNQIELAKWYSCADLFLICSSKENFPTTCLESLCCGTPVIGFNAGGTAETAEGKYGRFVEIGNIDLLEKSIIEYFKDPLNRYDVRNYAISRYSKNVMFRRYFTLYEELCKNVK